MTLFALAWRAGKQAVLRGRLLLFMLLVGSALCGAQQIRMSVLGLFRPTQVVLEPVDHTVLVLRSQPESKSRETVLNGEPGHRSALFQLQPDGVHALSTTAQEWTVTARDGGAAAFALQVPGKLRRSYRGRLFVRALADRIEVVIGMERETAVASIVSAEMDAAAPLEALKAQAVVTRSFLMAGHRHVNADFCDTTHCQFLKSPPPVGSRVWSAVNATRGIVLGYRSSVLAAMYSSRCGGSTRSLREAGYAATEESTEQYPYYAVVCDWCLRHPLLWNRHLDQRRRAPLPGDEQWRIAEVRQWGWGAIPGNNFSVDADSSGWSIEGHNVGHGLGMCQFGAMGMAESGASYRLILAHYYPNTSLREN